VNMQQLNSKDIIENKKKDFYSFILPKVKSMKRKVKDSLLGKANNVLVMPNENGLKLGPVIGEFDASKSYSKSYIDIVQDLALAINPYKISTYKPNIKNQDLQELSLSKNNVELDVSFENKLHYDFKEDSVLQPIGFKAKLKDINILENVKIPWQVDHVLEDKLKAVESISILQDYGFDNYYLTKGFSAGNFGLDKRYVTTRQSITALDDMLAKNILLKVKQYDSVDSYYVFENEFLHNKFIVVLGNGNFEYEQYELWPQESKWHNFGYNHEYEGYSGRTKYAESQAGGYYAARLAVVEYLNKINKQARVLVIREIYDDYAIPVGVWQVRENVRHAFSISKQFNSKKDLLEYIKGRLNYDLDVYVNTSNFFKQTRLSSFF